MKSRQAALRPLVYVAMSGGVDSSVAAHQLLRRGYRVVGVFMKPWQPAGAACLWKRDREDAVRVAAALNIALKTWDFSREYGRKVARPMIVAYRVGRTPNPDVECNRSIKFGLFARRAFREGADFIATGHYANIRNVRSKNREVRSVITAARDRNKDQTYFLWAVAPAVLRRVLFPIGHLTKPQVRTIARRAGLAVHGKHDSQGVCFIGELDMKSFLSTRIRIGSGVIMHTDGRTLGSHDGAAYYTIGQRHGLNLKDGGGPYFVVRTDVRRNIVTVGPEEALYAQSARLHGVNWHGAAPRAGERVSVQIRYRSRAVPALLGRAGKVTFLRPVRAVARGQSAVFYRGSRLLGGGILA